MMNRKIIARSFSWVSQRMIVHGTRRSPLLARGRDASFTGKRLTSAKSLKPNPLSSSNVSFKAAKIKKSEEGLDIEEIDYEKPSDIRIKGASMVVTQTREQNLLAVEKIINRTKDVSTLLELSTSKNINLKVLTLILERISTEVQNDASGKAELFNDTRFAALCNLVHQGNFGSSLMSLLRAYFAFKILETPQTSEILNTLSTEFSWVIRRCSIIMLCRAIFVLNDTEGLDLKMRDADDRKELLAAALDAFTLRWFEISNASELIQAFKIYHLIKDDIRSKIEDKGVGIVPTFSAEEIMKTFDVLASQKKRPTPLLRSLSFHFSKSGRSFSSKELIDLMYSMNELTFADPGLSERICQDLISKIPEIKNSAHVSSLVTSLGQMRYMNTDLMKALDTWVMKNSSALRPFDFAAWLLTIATLNWKSSNTNNFCDKAKTILTRENTPNPLDWLNIIHSFAVLDQCSDDMIDSVLSSSFVSSIKTVHPKATRHKTKLLNLNAIAGFRTSYKGHFLNEDTQQEWKKLLVTADPQLSKLTIETLANFMPPPKYLTTNFQSKTGVFIEGVCMLNEKLEPIPIVDLKMKRKDWIAVAVIVESYPMYCLGRQKAPTGQTLLNIRIVKDAGYHVVRVPFTEFTPSEKLLRRVQYLEQKIKSVDLTSETRESSHD